MAARSSSSGRWSSARSGRSTTAVGRAVCSTCASTPTRARTCGSQRAELRAHLARAIEKLPPRERHILALYYEQEMTLAEIGEVIGVGESRVSQLRTQAISRLRTSLREMLGIAERAA